MQAEALVVCLGYGSVMLRELEGLPIKCVAGQVLVPSLLLLIDPCCFLRQSLEFVRRGDEPPSDLKVSLLAGK